MGSIALPDVEAEAPLREAITAAAEERGVPVRLVREDTRFELSEGRSLSVFAPVMAEGTANELGLTVLASAGERDVLVTGDMEAEGERRLVQTVPLPCVEVLVAGHHGSDTSTTPELLEAVRPDLALISAGLNNKYGHPSWDTLYRLDQAGAKIYRTDLYGTIELLVKEK